MQCGVDKNAQCALEEFCSQTFDYGDKRMRKINEIS